MINEYIAYLRDVRRYSPRTQELYRAALEDFARWAEMPGQAGHDEKVTGHDVMADLIGHLVPSRIREYEANLIGRGMKPRTVHLHMSALSGYCNFLIKQGRMKSNPVRTVRRPKMEKRLPQYYRESSMDEYLRETAHAAGEDELTLLLSLEKDSKLFTEMYRRRLRRLIVSILYGTGIRRAELISLTVGSVDFSRGTLRVTGKGDKRRESPLIPSLIEEISLYLKNRLFVLLIL